MPKVLGQLAALVLSGSSDRVCQILAASFWRPVVARSIASLRLPFVEESGVLVPISSAKADPSTPASAAAVETSEASSLGVTPAGAVVISRMKYPYRPAKVKIAP